MITCNNTCPHDAKLNMCCHDCAKKDACEDLCEQLPESCGESLVESAGNETKALAAFQGGQMAAIEKVRAIVTQTKQLEDQVKEMKETLKAAMEFYGIKKFTSEDKLLTITYIAETTATSIDIPKLKAKYPDIAAECSKTSPKASYIKIEVK